MKEPTVAAARNTISAVPEPLGENPSTSSR
jgi:hypothetical protein